MTTSATTNKTWIIPPIVYDVIIPSSHATASMTARVPRVVTLLFVSETTD